MAKKQTFILEYQEDYDFLLVGIFCAYRDYRICFELNKVLELAFERIADLEIKMEKKGSTSLFPVFTGSNQDDEYYFVVGNKGTNGHFIPELKQIDFFLKIRNYSRYTEMNDLIRKIKSISIVSSVIEIEPEELKSAENFLLIEPA
jgi:hypothetical protein